MGKRMKERWIIMQKKFRSRKKGQNKTKQNKTVNH